LPPTFHERIKQLDTNSKDKSETSTVMRKIRTTTRKATTRKTA
jgi:hypothetical protein